jgi:hypothetical protein
VETKTLFKQNIRMGLVQQKVNGRALGLEIIPL